MEALSARVITQQEFSGQVNQAFSCTDDLLQAGLHKRVQK
jgi:hypothetical protein